MSSDKVSGGAPAGAETPAEVPERWTSLLTRIAASCLARTD